MSSLADLKQAVDYYRQQYDEMGSRLLRMQQELTLARRDSRRNRTITLIIQQLYEYAHQAAPAQPLGQTLIALLVDALRLDCAALLRWQDNSSLCQVEYGLGLHVGFILPFSEQGPLPLRVNSLQASTLPMITQAALYAEGLQAWLWIAMPGKNQALLLGNRQPCKLDSNLVLEETDQMIAAVALNVYRSLLEQQQTIQALRIAETNYRTLFESAHEAFAVLDISNGLLVDANLRAAELLGCSVDDLYRRNPLDWLVDSAALWKQHWLRALAGQPQMFECQLRTISGQIRWVEINLNRISATRPLLLAVLRDVTERRHNEQQLRQYAFHDALTQLPNRALIVEQLAQAIQQRRTRPEALFAVLFLDLNRFSVINDSLGHSIGDRLLIALGQRFGDCLRSGDIIARLGGDEFLILLNELHDPAEAIDCAERLEQALMVPITLDQHDIYTSASIGIVLADDRYNEPEALLRDADIAMYAAKQHNASRHRYTVFDPKMHLQAIQTMELERDLRRAVERREFVVYYQPIVHLQSGWLKGFEALVRWQHPERGLIAPDHFIPLAEETQLIVPIDHLVLEAACRQAALWASGYSPAPVININLSGRQFSSTDLVEYIRQQVYRSGCQPGLLNLEITESTLINDTEMAQTILQSLHDQGFRLSLDDFGTGYSSLSYLHQFPFDTLKIDRSFIQALGQDVKKGKIVNSIIALSRALGKAVVAEGVETQEQAAYLAMLGCDFGQGYYFSRPVDAQAAEALLDAPPWSIL